MEYSSLSVSPSIIDLLSNCGLCFCVCVCVCVCVNDVIMM